VTTAIRSHHRVAWRLFRSHWVAFLLAELTIVTAWVALEVVVIAVHRSPIPTVVGHVTWLALHFGFLWFFCALMTGIHAMALQAVAGRVPAFGTALSLFDRGQSYLLASLLYWAAVVAGLCLVIVPGFVVASRWALFRFVLADKTQSALASLHEAASLSAFHRWQLFRVLALSMALNLVGLALLGVGLLVTLPVTVLLRASYFRALQQQMTRRTD
jgi:uncharacterized membrane protein